MALMRIVTEPDPRFGRVSDRLRRKSEKIDVIDDEVRRLAADMHETMRAANGAGLAAPQVGVLKRLIVIQVPATDDDDAELLDLTLINPEIVKAGGREAGVEGCLSFPDLWGEVERYAHVIVQGFDEHGNKTRLKARGMLARALQHEIDHLDGVLYFDRMDDIGELVTSDELRAADEATTSSPAD